MEVLYYLKSDDFGCFISKSANFVDQNYPSFYFIFSGCFLYHLYKAKLNNMGIIILSVIRKKNNLMILNPESISTNTKYGYLTKVLNG